MCQTRFARRALEIKLIILSLISGCETCNFPVAKAKASRVKSNSQSYSGERETPGNKTGTPPSRCFLRGKLPLPRKARDSDSGVSRIGRLPVPPDAPGISGGHVRRTEDCYSRQQCGRNTGLTFGDVTLVNVDGPWQNLRKKKRKFERLTIQNMLRKTLRNWRSVKNMFRVLKWISETFWYVKIL